MKKLKSTKIWNCEFNHFQSISLLKGIINRYCLTLNIKTILKPCTRKYGKISRRIWWICKTKKQTNWISKVNNFVLYTGNLKIESFKRNLRTFFISWRSYCLKLKYSTDSFILFHFWYFVKWRRKLRVKTLLKIVELRKKKKPYKLLYKKNTENFFFIHNKKDQETTGMIFFFPF